MEFETIKKIDVREAYASLYGSESIPLEIEVLDAIVRVGGFGGDFQKYQLPQKSDVVASILLFKTILALHTKDSLEKVLENFSDVDSDKFLRVLAFLIKDGRNIKTLLLIEPFEGLKDNEEFGVFSIVDKTFQLACIDAGFVFHKNLSGSYEDLDKRNFVLHSKSRAPQEENSLIVGIVEGSTIMVASAISLGDWSLPSSSFRSKGRQLVALGAVRMSLIHLAYVRSISVFVKGRQLKVTVTEQKILCDCQDSCSSRFDGCSCICHRQLHDFVKELARAMFSSKPINFSPQVNRLVLALRSHINVLAKFPIFSSLSPFNWEDIVQKNNDKLELVAQTLFDVPKLHGQEFPSSMPDLTSLNMMLFLPPVWEAKDVARKLVDDTSGMELPQDIKYPFDTSDVEEELHRIQGSISSGSLIQFLPETGKPEGDDFVGNLVVKPDGNLDEISLGHSEGCLARGWTFVESDHLVLQLKYQLAGDEDLKELLKNELFRDDAESLSLWEIEQFNSERFVQNSYCFKVIEYIVSVSSGESNSIGSVQVVVENAVPQLPEGTREDRRGSFLPVVVSLGVLSAPESLSPAQTTILNNIYNNNGFERKS